VALSVSFFRECVFLANFFDARAYNATTVVFSELTYYDPLEEFAR